MFTRISSITLAFLLFFVLLGSQGNQYIYTASIVVLILAVFAINFKRLNFTWPHLLLPTIYLLGVASVFAVIADPNFRIVFLVAACLLFYVLEMKLGHESHFLQNMFLLSAFGLYLGLFAAQFYFNLKAWWFVPLVFLATYLLSVQGFAGFSLPAKRYFYLMHALVISEAAWGLIFWPTYFFVDSVVLFCIFYLLWLFSFSAFFGRLTRQKIYWQLTLVAIVLLLTLSTAAWRPLR